MRLKHMSGVAILATLFAAVTVSTAADDSGRSAPDAYFSLTQPAPLGHLARSDGAAPVAGRLAEDAVADRQSVDTFSSLEDGQPGPPGKIQVQFDLGWDTTSGKSDPILVQPQLQYTPDCDDFSRNTQFTLVVPVEVGNGGIDGNADVELGWQQRWISDDGSVPTVSTLLEVRLPSGYQSAGVDAKLTGIVVKDFGPGSLYLNAWAETANGDNLEDLRHFQWGFRTGYHWLINSEFALVADYAHQASEETGHGNINLLELGGEWHVADNLTIGPGISIGLDDNEETPNFGAGVRVVWAF